MTKLHLRAGLALVASLAVGAALGNAQQPPAVITVAPDSSRQPASTSSQAVAPTSASQTSTTTNCTGSAPGPDWTCINGAWQVASSVGSPGAAPASNGGGNCPAAQPGAGWICQNGSWMP